MVFKRRKIESCARLSSPRNAILAAALMIAAIYYAMSLLKDASPEMPLKKPSVYREAVRNVTKAVFSSRHVSASPLLYSKDPHQRQSKNGSVSLASNRDREDGKDILQSATILANFHTRVALHTRRRVVNPHPFEYIHNVPGACTSKTVEIMFGVLTRVDSFSARNAIRHSWGEFATDANNKAVVLFFLGSTHDKTLQEKINTEAKKNGDIIQETFIDSYKNLSLKTIALVKWASVYCQDSTYVVKADDDIYINVPRLLSKLRTQLDNGPLFIMGKLLPDSRPFRTKGHKWFVPPSEYRLKEYPNYVSGTTYAMTTTAAMRLYVESFYVRLLYLEDVYLTGILADKASVPRVSESEFSAVKFEPTGCNFKSRISGHQYLPDELLKIHRELFDPDLRCR